MSEPSALDSKVSMTCARCSGRISEPSAFSFCPYCGAPLGSADRASSAPPTQGGDVPAAVPYQPPMRAFAATDFEGDLDGPAGGFVDSGAEPRDGEGYGRASAFALSGWRQWGVKGGLGILASCVVLFTGLTLMHRFEGPSDAALSDESASLVADGSATRNEPEPANLSGPAKDDLRAQESVGTGRGASEAEPGAAPPVVANEGGARSHAGRAGAAQRRHLGHGRTRTHGSARYWRPPARDTTYLHSDAQPLRPSSSVTARA